MKNTFVRVWFAMALGLVIAGCSGESINPDGESGGANTDGGGEAPPAAVASAVGVWTLYEGTAVQGAPYWYATFNPEGTFTIHDNPDGSAQRVNGTWSQDGNTVTGPFVNPGVGEGRIDATITDGVMQMDFVEFWVTPPKVVPYAGVKR